MFGAPIASCARGPAAKPPAVHLASPALAPKIDWLAAVDTLVAGLDPVAVDSGRSVVAGPGLAADFYPVADRVAGFGLAVAIAPAVVGSAAVAGRRLAVPRADADLASAAVVAVPAAAARPAVVCAVGSASGFGLAVDCVAASVLVAGVESAVDFLCLVLSAAAYSGPVADYCADPAGQAFSCLCSGLPERIRRLRSGDRLALS